MALGGMHLNLSVQDRAARLSLREHETDRGWAKEKMT